MRKLILSALFLIGYPRKTVSFILLLLTGFGLNAQPLSNPTTVSNNPLVDVVRANFVATDSALFYTEIYIDYSPSFVYTGSSVKKLDLSGNVIDSFALEFPPHFPTVGSRGMYYNDSITVFGRYLDYQDTLVKHFILRLATDFSGSRHNFFFSHASHYPFVGQSDFDTHRDVYRALMPVDRPGPAGKETYYFEFDPGSLELTRHDTIRLFNPVAKFMADFKYYRGNYYGFHSSSFIKYNNNLDSIGLHRFRYSNSSVNSFSLPYEGMVLNNKLFGFSLWSEEFSNVTSKTSIVVLDSKDSTWHVEYENPKPHIYEDEMIDYDGMYQFDDNFLLLSTLNYSKGFTSGGPLGYDTDIMVRLVDTASLQLKHEYVLVDSCMAYVTGAVQTKDGFAILYYANCNPFDITREVKIAFFNDQAQMLSNVSVAKLPQLSDNNLKLFPNPVEDVLHLELSEHFTHQSWTLKFYDINGKLIREEKGHGRDGGYNVSSLAPGSYFLLLEAERAIRLNGSFVKTVN